MKFLNENRKFLRIAGNPVIRVLLFLLSVTVYGQNTDSLPLPGQRQYSWIKPAIAPCLLGTTGLLIQQFDFPVSDAEIRDQAFKQAGFSHKSWDDYLMFAPLGMVGGLHVAGVEGKHSLPDQSALLLLSLCAQGTLVYALKYTTDVQRPDGSTFDAFPSGHSALAFSTATFLHLEYGEQSGWYTLAAYAPAIATGVNRILRDRHWASDVLFGAAIGIGITRGVYWMYPKIRGRLYRTLHLKNLNHGITFD